MENFILKVDNGRQCTICFHLEQWLASDFKNAQWGLNIDSKFFKTKIGAVNYALKAMTTRGL